MKQSLLTLKIPGGNNEQVEISAPPGIPTGGLSRDGGAILKFGITLFLITCVILALAVTVYGGYLWITSYGDKTKLESARKTIIYAMFGLLIALLSFFFINLFESFFGIKLLDITLGQ